jgi:2-polyprenyl-3-methyl-5-hydroxy-6-metoxy-1,4-benzoquinol methylase
VNDFAHWQNVYRTKPADNVSWYRPHLEVSLSLLKKAGLGSTSRVIDIGAGASTLVDDLLDLKVGSVTALDISEEALQIAKHRLGPKKDQIDWRVASVVESRFESGTFDFWHDRAVLHFLTDTQDSNRYVDNAKQAISVGGHAVIGCFASDGPERCSGLTVIRRDPEQIARLFGSTFSLVTATREHHVTPGGVSQSFAYALLKKMSE